MKSKVKFADLAPKLVTAGYEPLPIKHGNKVPYIEGWSQMTVDAEQVKQWASNGKASHYVGIRTGRVVALDIDIDNAEVTDEIVNSALWDLGDGLRRRGRPGRLTVLYRVEGEPGRKRKVSLVDPDGGEHDIEILATGQQFVAYGQHPEGYEYTWLESGPLDVSFDDLPPVTMQEVDDWLQSVCESLPEGWYVATRQSGLDEDERFLMSYVSPDAVKAMSADKRVNYEAMRNFDAWVPELFGDDAKPALGGYRISSKALGRDLQEDLSIHPEGIRDHGEERGMTPVQVVERWAETDDAVAWLAERLGVDIEAQEQLAQETRKQAVNQREGVDWRGKIEAADTLVELERIAQQGIARDRRVIATERERLVGALVSREKEIEGKTVGKRAWAKLCTPTKKPAERSTVTEKPEWCEGWYYVGLMEKFYKHSDGRWLTVGSFDRSYGREMPVDDEGRRASACAFALHEVQIPCVHKAIYAPHLPEQFDLGGHSCVNTFVPSSIPETADVVSDAGREAVRLVEDHVQRLCGDRLDIATDLLDWIAFCVQKPGEKIRFAPLIKGIEGDGKTVLLEMLATMLGEPNVKVVGPQVLLGQFNGYAEGSCVVGLEEIRIAGHNRHDALNALKPLITNSTVDIHKKGVDAYNALNVTNYIAFTNHGDALPLSSSDRRWFVIGTPWSSREEMEKIVGCSHQAYFDRLTSAIKDFGAELRRHFLDYSISATFSQHGPAPMTPEKEAMRLADADVFDDALEDILSVGAPGVSKRVISTSHLRSAAVDFIGGDAIELPQGKTLAKILSKAGWSKSPKQIKWRGHPVRVWVKGIRLDDVDAIRAALDETDAGEFG